MLLEMTYLVTMLKRSRQFHSENVNQVGQAMGLWPLCSTGMEMDGLFTGDRPELVMRITVAALVPDY